MSERTPLRVGAVGYLNALPLTIALRDDLRVDVVEDVPSVVADDLAASRIDVGLVPLADILRHGWTRVPGLGIASLGPVETVLLVSNVPFARIERVGMDVSSRTSVVLTRLVLRRRFGVDPEPSPARPAEGTPDEPAWLVIGDPAFGVERDGGRRILDLGEAWTDLDGLPMVYAAWAVRDGMDPARVAPVLEAAAATGRETLEAWLGAEAAIRGLSPERCRRYLREVIRYEVGDDEERGIEAFARLAREGGLL